MTKRLVAICLLINLCFSFNLRSNEEGVSKPVSDKQVKSMAYISTVKNWYGAGVLDNLGINSCYDIMIMTFWLSTSGPADLVYFYDNIYNYVGSDIYGNSTEAIQQYVHDQFKRNGKSLFISAFGDTDYPTKSDPNLVATNLANWLNAHPFIEGVDVDYEDNQAITDGTGVTWLIQFTKTLRNKLNNKNIILTHAPQAPYFSREYYNDGAYYQIDQEVGDLIDWYNVQFYNQNDNKYDTYQSLIISSGKWFYNTSYQEIIQNNNVPANKLVLGKPAIPKDANNSGYVEPLLLGQIVRQAKDEAGIVIPAFFIWQFIHDIDCTYHDQFFIGYNTQNITKSIY